jgi:hypothetical protein
VKWKAKRPLLFIVMLCLAIVFPCFFNVTLAPIVHADPPFHVNEFIMLYGPWGATPYFPQWQNALNDGTFCHFDMFGLDPAGLDGNVSVSTLKNLNYAAFGLPARNPKLVIFIDLPSTLHGTPSADHSTLEYWRGLVNSTNGFDNNLVWNDYTQSDANYWGKKFVKLVQVIQTMGHPIDGIVFDRGEAYDYGGHGTEIGALYQWFAVNYPAMPMLSNVGYPNELSWAYSPFIVQYEGFCQGNYNDNAMSVADSMLRDFNLVKTVTSAGGTIMAYCNWNYIHGITWETYTTIPNTAANCKLILGTYLCAVASINFTNNWFCWNGPTNWQDCGTNWYPIMDQVNNLGDLLVMQS